MVGDFYMAFFSVIVELRARVFQINLAAWYPFNIQIMKMRPGRTLAVFFCIGPWKGTRIMFDCTVFRMPAPAWTDNNSMVMEIERDAGGKTNERHPYAVTKYDLQDQGYPLKRYMPKCERIKDKYVGWMFEPVNDKTQSAVAEIREAMRKEPDMFQRPLPGFTTGECSWDWSVMPISKQHMVEKEKSIQTILQKRSPHAPDNLHR